MTSAILTCLLALAPAPDDSTAVADAPASDAPSAPEPAAVDPEPAPEPAATATAPAPAPAEPAAVAPAVAVTKAKDEPAPARSRIANILDPTTGWIPNTWPLQQPCDFLSPTRPVCLILRTDVFTGFRYSAFAGGGMSEFRLDRGEIGTGLTWKPMRRLETGVIVAVEAVRSAGPQSAVGIDGDALVMRLLEAYGHGAMHFGPIDIGVRAGLVPERWIELLERGYDTRGLDAIPSDRNRFFDRSDLGATLTVSGWKGLAEVDVEVMNGEGRSQEELNRGKNTTVIATVRPLRRERPQGPIVLALHGAYRDGSLGIAAARDHRGSAAVTFASPWVYAGFEYAHALGSGARAGLVANTLGGWASARILPRWLGAMGKYDRTQQDLAAARSVVHVLTAGLFSDVFPHVDRNRRRIRVYAAYQYEAYGDAAAPLPGTPEALDTHRVLIQLEARGLARIGMSTQENRK